MKKTLNRFFIAITLVIFAVGFTACGDDDDDTTSNDAVKMVVGTYSGTLRVNAIGTPQSAILTISDAGGGKVKLTTDVGNTTPKEVLVTVLPDGATVSGESDAASLGYVSSTKLLIVGTKQQQASDVTYTFEGTKR